MAATPRLSSPSTRRPAKRAGRGRGDIHSTRRTRARSSFGRVSYADGFSNVPRPVYGHGLVYIATGFQEPSLLAVRVDGTGDVTKTHVAWTRRRAAPLTPSPLLAGDELYIVNDVG